jgi:hypothetical protein
MQQFQSYYKSEARTIQTSFSQGVLSANKISFYKPKSKAEAKQLAAKKHSEAERRRRMRINGQYATLRNILPNLIKVSICEFMKLVSLLLASKHVINKKIDVRLLS